MLQGLFIYRAGPCCHNCVPIDGCYVQVPWNKLGQAPVIVEFDRLYILAGPKASSVLHPFTTADAHMTCVLCVCMRGGGYGWQSPEDKMRAGLTLGHLIHNLVMSTVIVILPLSIETDAEADVYKHFGAHTCTC